MFLIEDCAESAGAKDLNGNLTGTVGDISCWSFQSAKQLTCGDGGIITCKNKKLATKVIVDISYENGIEEKKYFKKAI